MNLLKSALAFLCLLFAVSHPYVHLFQVDFGLWGGGLPKWKIVENIFCDISWLFQSTFIEDS